MSYFFLELLKLSISASFLIIAVIFLRLLMRKSPKSFYCLLWALVGIRLICPFSFESRYSVIPKEEVIPINTIFTVPDTQTELDVTNTGNFTPNEVLFESDNSLVTNKSFNLVDIVSTVWITGTITIVLYGIISYIRLKRIVSVSINDKENIYLCDNIDVPFIFGIFKPKIYLPSNMAENQKEFVLLHEKAHLSRHDNLWKPIGFILLSIYWFNPLVWIAYHLFSKDIELATDEKVINNLNSNEIKGYSETLLSCSLVKSTVMIKICPVAFGEVGVKDRIKAVLSYKKPSFWIILITVISCIIVGVCFLTKPKDNKLTISKVKELVSKGNNLTLGDFKQYEGTDIGSGLYIMRYDVEPNHYLLIYPISSKKDSKIFNAYFIPYKNFDEKVDVFTQDIEEYLEKKNDSISQVIKNEYKNILGYDTYYIDTEMFSNWYTRDYYTKYDDKDILIAESYGFEKEREDTIKDLDKDGYTELICNCVSGADGHEEAYIFMRDLTNSSNTPSALVGYIDREKLNLQDYFDGGVNSFSTKYEPNNNRFAVTYSKGNKNKSEGVTIYINDNEIMDKLSFEKHIVSNDIGSDEPLSNDSIKPTNYEKERQVSYSLSNSGLNGLNLENLQYSVKAQKLLPFADDPEVYKELEYISKQDFSILKEIWSKLPDNIVTFNDNIFDTNIKNSGLYYEKIDENNTNYYRTITNEQAIKIIRNKYRGVLSDKFDEFEVKSQFVLFTDLYQNINREPVILVTVQGTFKTTEEMKKSVKEYWEEKIGSNIIDNINLDKSSQLYVYLLDPNNGQEIEDSGHFEMNHINYSNN